MIKEALADLGLGTLAVIGLVVFFTVFLGVVAWVLTRSRRQVDRWASLPLADGTEPVEARDAADAKRDDGHGHHGEGGCGQCAECSCAPADLTTITTLTTTAAPLSRQRSHQESTMADSPNPTDPTDDVVMSGHTYDGIQEYDNPTPRWWDLLFVATIVFSPIYALWFHSPQKGRNIEGQYERALAANMRLQFGEIGDLEPNEATLVRFMGEPEWLKVGESTFVTNCVSCHGREGEGISGPNLTDDYYINVKEITDIAKVVAEGAKKGAMPAWGNRLHPNEVVLVSAYVASLRGQDLPTKYQADKGKEIEPWPAAPPAEEVGEEPDAGQQVSTPPSTTDRG